ncbi:MAG TPA: MBL fold metallo-hydrolase [Anaerolineales bacterium]|nr:MBL fold metallo-hydrolase [Anaerolineales bacterium]
MKFGDLEIHTVSDGLVHVDAGGPFGLVPRPLYAPEYTPDESNTIPMALTCLLVRSGGQTILIDTGLGDKLDAAGQARWRLERPLGGLVEALARLGVSPEDVDIVVNTHLHGDHCGGNTRHVDGQVVATFPRATYLVQRMEWADASHPDARTRSTYALENFEPLLRESRMRLLHGDTTVAPGVRCIVTPGHTHAHQSLLLEDGGWHGFYPADLASYAVHLARLSWMTAYDAEPLETLRTKRQWQPWLAEREATIFFEHDAGLPIGRLVRHEGRFEIEPISPSG